MAKDDKPIARLIHSRFKEAEHARGTVRYLEADPGHSIEDLKNPEYWANVSAQMSPWMRVEARAKDGSWMADLVVTSVGRNWARVKVLNYWPLATADVERTETGTHEVVFRESKGWSVIRKADRAVLREGEETREQAEAWLTKHLKENASAAATS